MMKSTWCGLLLAAAALGVPAAPALATTCYFVLDRSDNTIYRDQQPPVDMSERGAASRDAMRQRGEYLMFVDSDRCAPITFVIGPGTPGTLSVDDIVAGFPTMAKADPSSSVVARRASTGAGATARATSNAAKQSYQAPRRR